MSETRRHYASLARWATDRRQEAARPRLTLVSAGAAEKFEGGKQITLPPREYVSLASWAARRRERTEAQVAHVPANGAAPSLRSNAA